MSDPRNLFKYRAVNDFLQDILVHHELWFANAASFNDPFDCAPVFATDARPSEYQAHLKKTVHLDNPGASRSQRRQEVKRARKVTNLTVSKMGKPEGDKIVTDVFMGQVEKTGILSLSACNDSVLMWSHYAAQHSGICLQFAGSAPLLDEAFAVAYSKQRPVINFIRDNKLMIEKGLFLKADYWSYEEEWRILARHHIGPQTFDPAALTGIIFGAKTSIEDENQVRLWATSGKLRAQYYRAKLHPHEFRIQIDPAVAPAP